MLLNIGKYGEQDYKQSLEWLVNTDPDLISVLNSLPNDKILDLSKLKAFADDKINETQKLKFKLGRLENTVGKG